jgi:hypothetical protein
VGCIIELGTLGEAVLPVVFVATTGVVSIFVIIFEVLGFKGWVLAIVARVWLALTCILTAEELLDELVHSLDHEEADSWWSLKVEVEDEKTVVFGRRCFVIKRLR